MFNSWLYSSAILILSTVLVSALNIPNASGQLSIFRSPMMLLLADEFQWSPTLVITLSVAGVLLLAGIGYIGYKYSQWVARGSPRSKEGYRSLAKAKVSSTSEAETPVSSPSSSQPVRQV